MIHALGESTDKPVFAPFEQKSGVIIPADVRYYPAVRKKFGIVNQQHLEVCDYPAYSKLDQVSDWVAIDAYTNQVVDGESRLQTKKWILSIGGRIGDFSIILESINALTEMLKCGFECDHYRPNIKLEKKNEILKTLNFDEKIIFSRVCAL